MLAVRTGINSFEALSGYRWATCFHVTLLVGESVALTLWFLYRFALKVCTLARPCFASACVGIADFPISVYHSMLMLSLLYQTCML